MYKIYINDTPIFLTNTKTAKKLTRDDSNLVALHRHRKALFQYVDSLEKNHQFDSITIHSLELPPPHAVSNNKVSKVRGVLIISISSSP